MVAVDGFVVVVVVVGVGSVPCDKNLVHGEKTVDQSNRQTARMNIQYVY
jgi:hypothetical protein